MASLLYRIGAFAARRHWVVLAVWLVIFLATSLGAGALGKNFVAAFDVPGTQSQQALDVLNTRFPMASSSSIKVLFEAPSGKTIDDFRSQIESTLTNLQSVKGIDSIVSPFDADGASAMSDNRTIAYATLTMNGEGGATAPNGQTPAQTSVYETTQKAQAGGLTVAYVGLPDPAAAGDIGPEGIGLIVSLVVLIITFGSLLAAGMPLITAIVGVGISTSVVTLLSWVMVINVTGPTLSAMLGLAVGIDYALFLVSRHRSNLAQGMPVRQSVAVATATAGSAVVFAGLTVIIALLGLFVVNIPFLGMMGFGAAIAVAIAIAVATTLVPAILSLFGRALIPRPTSRAFKREQADAPATMGARWARIVTAKPLITVLAVLVGLAILALPVSSLRLALPDAGYDPPGSITRSGYDLMAKGFGAGANGPLIAVADVSRLNLKQVVSAVDSLPAFLKSQPGVADVLITTPNPQLDVIISVITPKTAPDAPETEALVNSLRNKASEFQAKNGFTYEITGQTALGIDISNRLGDAIIPFGILVVGLSIVLLAAVFRSIAVPLTATLGFVLSVLAAFGVTTAVFVWGWGAAFLGVPKAGPVVAFMPILVMAVLFGLAMDYEVFLVSRMRERFVATGNPKESVVTGFAHSARVVTAASLIMFSVFVAFVPGQGVLMQPIALALAVGVAIDAMVIRMTLIPALMTLLGRYAWALPRWLARRLPDVDIEGEKVHGRIATLAWHQGADSAVVVAAQDLKVADSALGPTSFTLSRGQVGLVVASLDGDADLLLAALTGRADARGMLISCGRPLPYDGSHVRRLTSLVVPGAAPMEGSVVDQIREQLRLNQLPATLSSVEDIRGLVNLLAVASGMTVGDLSDARPAEALTTSESWLVDLAVALRGNAELIAVDARALAEEAVAPFMAETLAQAATETTLVLAVPRVGAGKVSGRTVVRLPLKELAEVSP